MSHFYPPPMPGPAWYSPAGLGVPAWSPPPGPGAPSWRPYPGALHGLYPAAYVLYPVAGMAAAGGYAAPDWPRAADPAPVEWVALVEPALNSVIPAIQGLLEISGLLLGRLPAFDAAGSGPGEAAPDDPLTLRTGLGHIGMFGPAGPDVIDIETARSDAALPPPEASSRDGADAGDLGGEQTEQA